MRFECLRGGGDMAGYVTGKGLRDGSRRKDWRR